MLSVITDYRSLERDAVTDAIWEMFGHTHIHLLFFLSLSLILFLFRVYQYHLTIHMHTHTHTPEMQGKVNL